MNIEQLKVNAINNILSVSGKEKTSQVIREEIDKIIMVLSLLSKNSNGEYNEVIEQFKQEYLDVK